jgi:flagellar basal-body rod protein FlgC
MDYFKATEISAAGMAVQKARVEAAALNIANMNSSVPPGARPYQPVTALIHPSPAQFSRWVDGSAPTVTPMAELVPQRGLALRQSYEPGHPHADSAGMVTYPSVDHTQEMLTVVTALRSYEANLAALQATKTMAARALEIGGQ